ncbi:hypothetical protein RQM47_04685 [Rubrivirga sp. S365]|uniref:Uncharacterized protein n=1 Tax=Rubrivirga litoralis TaxID=3075598 RepID=A0ABU3BPZ7_9BACT|nr:MULTISPECIES: hypothetical protein [unclassified Rubrivirga]MDT0631338.1 hypothetical protein [Rubrivirga sp. F394]MDT7855929.1 hypothetical protein [Rubrivirga sp. S365]
MDDPPRLPNDEPDELPGTPMPNPHRGEPAAAEDEGVRPEAAGTPARPTGDEPLGPYGELVPTAAVEAEDEATPDGDPEAEALLEQMGVEEEGIESGQILGLIISVGVGIVALVVGLIYLFVIPFQAQVGAEAENVVLYPELLQVRVEGLAKLTDYERADSSTYGVPISQAMGLVAAEYGAARAGAAEVPTTRQRWNTLPISIGPPRAVQVPSDRGPLTAPLPGINPLSPTGEPDTIQEAETTPFQLRVETGEEVGVDEGAEAPFDRN